MKSQLKVLVDTSIWLDKYLMDRKGAAAANELLALCVAEDVALLYPLHALHDVFWQVSADIKGWVQQSYGDMSEHWEPVINGRAWDCVDNMTELGAPVGADGSDVWIARHLREINTDFEDNMVLAAAERAKADYLVTRDKHLIQKATVAALTPEGMLAVLRMRKDGPQGASA